MGMRTALLPATLWAAAASGGKGGDGPGSDDAAASKGIDRAPPIGQAGPAGTLATHAVVRGHDPSSGLQLARTVILRAGGQERGDSGSNAAVSAALSALQKGHTLAQKAMASCMARCARPASGAAGAGGELDAGPRLVRLAAAALAALTRAWGFPAIAETLGKEAIQTAKSTLQVAIDVTNAAGQLECSVRATPAGCSGSVDAEKAGESTAPVQRTRVEGRAGSGEQDVDVDVAGECAAALSSRVLVVSCCCGDVRVLGRAIGAMLLTDSIVLVPEHIGVQ